MENWNLALLNGGELLDRLTRAAEAGIWGLIPLGVASAGLLALVLVRRRKYRRRRLFPPKLILELEVVARGTQPDREQLSRLAEAHESPLSNVVRQVLRLQEFTLLERNQLAGEVQANELAELKQGNGLFDVFYSVSTLLGLLGALMGLIDAFARQASPEGASGNAVITASVAPALCATAGGVLLAIAARVLGQYFHGLHERRRRELTRYVLPLVRQLRPAAPAPSSPTVAERNGRGEVLQLKSH